MACPKLDRTDMLVYLGVVLKFHPEVFANDEVGENETSLVLTKMLDKIIKANFPVNGKGLIEAFIADPNGQVFSDFSIVWQEARSALVDMTKTSVGREFQFGMGQLLKMSMEIFKAYVSEPVFDVVVEPDKPAAKPEEKPEEITDVPNPDFGTTSEIKSDSLTAETPISKTTDDGSVSGEAEHSEIKDILGMDKMHLYDELVNYFHRRVSDGWINQEVDKDGKVVGFVSINYSARNIIATINNAVSSYFSSLSNGEILEITDEGKSSSKLIYFDRNRLPKGVTLEQQGEGFEVYSHMAIRTGILNTNGSQSKVKFITGDNMNAAIAGLEAANKSKVAITKEYVAYSPTEDQLDYEFKDASKFTPETKEIFFGFMISKNADVFFKKFYPQLAKGYKEKFRTGFVNNAAGVAASDSQSAAAKIHQVTTKRLVFEGFDEDNNPILKQDVSRPYLTSNDFDQIYDTIQKASFSKDRIRLERELFEFITKNKSTEAGQILASIYYRFFAPGDYKVDGKMFRSMASIAVRNRYQSLTLEDYKNGITTKNSTDLETNNHLLEHSLSGMISVLSSAVAHESIQSVNHKSKTTNSGSFGNLPRFRDEFASPYISVKRGLSVYTKPEILNDPENDSFGLSVHPMDGRFEIVIKNTSGEDLRYIITPSKITNGKPSDGFPYKIEILHEPLSNTDLKKIFSQFSLPNSILSNNFANEFSSNLDLLKDESQRKNTLEKFLLTNVLIMEMNQEHSNLIDSSSKNFIKTGVTTTALTYDPVGTMWGYEEILKTTLGSLYGVDNRVYSKDHEGNRIANVSVRNKVSDSAGLAERQSKDPRFHNSIHKGSPITGSDPNFKIRNLFSKTGIKVGDTVKSNQQMTILEQSKFQIEEGYLQHAENSNFEKILLQFGVMSDRTDIPMVEFQNQRIKEGKSENGFLPSVNRKLDRKSLQDRVIESQSTYWANVANITKLEWKTALGKAGVQLVFRPGITYDTASIYDVANAITDAKIPYNLISENTELVKNVMLTDVGGTAQIPLPTLQNIKLFSNRTLAERFIKLSLTTFKNQLKREGFTSLSPASLVILRKRFDFDDEADALNIVLDSFFYDSNLLGNALLRLHTGGYVQFNHGRKQSYFKVNDNEDLNPEDIIAQAENIPVKIGSVTSTLGQLTMGVILETGNTELIYYKSILENKALGDEKTNRKIVADALFFDDIMKVQSNQFIDQIKRNAGMGSTHQSPRLVSTNEAGMFLGQHSKNITMLDPKNDIMRIIGKSGFQKVDKFDAVQIGHPLYFLRLYRGLGGEESGYAPDGAPVKDITNEVDANGFYRFQKKATFDIFSNEILKGKATPELYSLLKRMNTAVRFDVPSMMVYKIDPITLKPVVGEFNTNISKEMWLSNGPALNFVLDTQTGRVINIKQELADLSTKVQEARSAGLVGTATNLLQDFETRFTPDANGNTRYKTDKVIQSFENLQQLWEYYGSIDNDEAWTMVAETIGYVSGNATKIDLSDATYPNRDSYIEKLGFKTQEKTGSKQLLSSNALKDPNILFDNAWSRVDNTYHGVILQASHNPDTTSAEGSFQADVEDENEIPMITQVLSACVGEGNTLASAADAYDAVGTASVAFIENLESELHRKVTEILVKDGKQVYKESSAYIEARSAVIAEYIRKLTAEGLSNRSAAGIIGELVGPQLSNSLSYNLKQVLPLIVSMLNSRFNKNTVRMKFPGGQYIVSPSDGLINSYSLTDKNGKVLVTGLNRQDLNKILYDKEANKRIYEALEGNEKYGWKPVDISNILPNDFVKISPSVHQVSPIFAENPQLAEIGSETQYGKYLDTIFPESTVRNILYHGTDEDLAKGFDTSKKKPGSGSGSPHMVGHVYTSFQRHSTIPYITGAGTKGINVKFITQYFEVKELFKKLNKVSENDSSWHIKPIKDLKADDAKITEYAVKYGLDPDSTLETLLNTVYDLDINQSFEQWRLQKSDYYKSLEYDGKKPYAVLVNVANPVVGEGRDTTYKEELAQAKKGKNDGLVMYKNNDAFNSDVVVAFKPEQVHILGSEADIQGFKNFVATAIPEPNEGKVMMVSELKRNMKASNPTMSDNDFNEFLTTNAKYRLADTKSDSETLQWNRYYKYDEDGTRMEIKDSPAYIAFQQVDLIADGKKIREEFISPELVKMFYFDEGPGRFRAELNPDLNPEYLKENWTPSDEKSFNDWLVKEPLADHFAEEYIKRKMSENPYFRKKLEKKLFDELERDGWENEPAEFYMPPMHGKRFLIKNGDSLFDIIGSKMPDFNKLLSLGILKPGTYTDGVNTVSFKTKEDIKRYLNKHHNGVYNTKFKSKLDAILKNGGYYDNMSDDHKSVYNTVMHDKNTQYHRSVVYFDKRLREVYGPVFAKIQNAKSLRGASSLIKEEMDHTSSDSELYIALSKYKAIIDNGLVEIDSTKNEEKPFTVKDLFVRLHNQEISSTFYEERSHKMAAGFPTTLEFITARIPAQGMQSFTAAKIKNFVFSTKNSCYGPLEMLKMTGADYDIDKQNMMTWSVTMDGEIVDWEPFLDDNGKMSYKKFKEWSKTAKLSSHEAEETFKNATQNYIIHKILSIIKAPVNAIQANTPVSLDKAGNAIKSPDLGRAATASTLSELIEMREHASPFNPYSMFQYEKLNMDGKSGIGIFASDLKAYFAAYYATISSTEAEKTNVEFRSNSGLSETDMEDEKINPNAVQYFDLKTGKKIAESFSIANTTKFTATGKLHLEKSKAYRSELASKSLDDTAGQFEVLSKYIESVGIIGDANVSEQAWEDLSELLSAATDNAKELILGKINATANTSSIISTMIRMGIDLKYALELVGHSDKVSPVQVIIGDKQYTIHSIKELITLLEKVDDTQVDITGSNRLLSVLKDIQPQLQSLSKKDYLANPFRQLYTFTAMTEEFGLLASFLSINQGIKNNAYDSWKFRTSLELRMTDILKRAQKGFEFNLENFIDGLANRGVNDNQTNIKHADDVIRLFNQARTGINVPFIISKNKHYFGYYQAMYKSIEMVNAVSDIDKITENLFKKSKNPEVKRRIDLSRYKALQDFIYSVGVEKYMKDVVKIVTLNGVQFDLTIPSRPFTDKNTIGGRLEFINYLPKVVKAEASKRQDNYFLESLPVQNVSEDFITKISLPILKGPDLNNISSERFNRLQVGLSKLEIDNPALHAALFNYSLITTKGGYAGGSFMGLYSPSYYAKYSAYIKQQSPAIKSIVENSATWDSIQLNNSAFLKEVKTYPIYKIPRKSRSEDDYNEHFESEPDFSMEDNYEDYESREEGSSSVSTSTDITELKLKGKIKEDIIVSNETGIVYKWSRVDNSDNKKGAKMWVPLVQFLPKGIIPYTAVNTKGDLSDTGFEYGWKFQLNETDQAGNPKFGHIMSYVYPSLIKRLKSDSVFAKALNLTDEDLKKKKDNYLVKVGDEYRFMTRDEILDDTETNLDLYKDRIVINSTINKENEVINTSMAFYKNTTTGQLTLQKPSLDIDAEKSLWSNFRPSRVANSSALIGGIEKSSMVAIFRTKSGEPNKYPTSNYNVDKEFSKMKEDYLNSLFKENFPGVTDYKDIALYSRPEHQKLRDRLHREVNYLFRPDLHLIEKMNMLYLRNNMFEEFKTPEKTTSPLPETIPSAIKTALTSEESIQSMKWDSLEKLFKNIGIPQSEFDKLVTKNLLTTGGKYDLFIGADNNHVVFKKGKEPRFYSNTPKSKKLSLPETMRQSFNKQASPEILSRVAKALNKRFPNSTFSVLSTKDIELQYGKQYSMPDVKAFVINGEVVINSDRATLDTPMHEFTHIYMQYLKVEDPDLYLKIVNDALQHPLAKHIRKSYPDLGKYELGEEVFVSLVGSVVSDKALDNTALTRIINNTSSGSNVFSKIKNFFKSIFGEMFGTKMDDFDLSMNDSLNTIIEKLGNNIAYGKKSILSGISNTTKQAIENARRGSDLDYKAAKQFLMDRGFIKIVCT